MTTTSSESVTSTSSVTDPTVGSAAATWPGDLERPDGLTVVDASVGPGETTTVKATCTGSGSDMLTAMTTILNEAGLRTNWILKTTDDAQQPAVVEGTSTKRNVRAEISADASGTCRQVVVVFTG